MRKQTISLNTRRIPRAANDNNASGVREVNIHLPHVVPVSIAEIEIFNLLVGDLENIVANDNVPDVPPQ